MKKAIIRKNSVIQNEYVITALLVTCVYLCACAFKHIYPFGNQYLINENDFRAQSLPIYMHVWDALHGKSSLFFEWRIGLGSNFAGTISHFSLLSPFSLFFLFVSREGLMASMTWFILLKLIAMALSMCLFLKQDPLFFHDRKLSSVWVIIGSLAYALNGYTMQYYGFPWLDVAVFLPLLLLNLDGILVSDRKSYGAQELGYVLFLGLILIINIPQAFAVCLFLIGYVCGYLFLANREKERRNTVSIKIILLSIIGVLLSMAIFLPASHHIFQSYRYTVYGDYGNALQNYIVKMDLPKQETVRKYRIVLGVIVPLLLSLRHIWSQYRQNGISRSILFEGYLLLLVLCPVVFESVNGMYHNGPYSCYPMRYGFLTSLIVILCGLRGISEEKMSKPVLKAVSGIAWAGVMIAFTITRVEPSASYDYHEFLASLDNGSSVFERVKLTDESMEENFPLYLNQYGFSNYVPLNSAEQIEFAQNMGYAQDWVQLIDSGGTMFSDAVMGMNTMIHTVPDGAYAEDHTSLGLFKTDTGGALQKETLNYHYRNAFFIPEDRFRRLEEYGNNPFESQNQLSEQLIGKSLFTTETFELSDQNTAEFELSCSDREGLYFWTGDLQNIEIRVNGNTLPVPNRKIPENTTYSDHVRYGILPLGFYENQEITLTVQSSSDESISGKILIGHLNLDEYIKSTESSVQIDELKNGANSLSFVYESDAKGYLVLPLYAEKGWSCRVNGQKQELDDLYGMLTVIPVEEGRNEVAMRFTPLHLTVGWLLSFASLAAVLLLVLCKRITEAAWYRKLAGAAVFLLGAVWIFYLAYIYVIPIVFRVGMSLYKRLF